ncbi:MAG: hypothetical protein WBW35_04260, partial [Xanthobacteraceae bacterium]
IVDMSASNAWAEFAAVFAETRSAYLDHERAKAELKGLMPEDAIPAIAGGPNAAARRDAAAQVYRGRPIIPGDSTRKRSSRIRLGIRQPLTVTTKV